MKMKFTFTIAGEGEWVGPDGSAMPMTSYTCTLPFAKIKHLLSDRPLRGQKRRKLR